MTEEPFARYDSADYLKTEEDVAAYLEAAMEEGGDDPAYVARARGGVDHVETLAPADAPDWVQDRAALWNAVELAETRKNSQVAREVRVALPCELDAAQRLQLVRDFCQRAFVDRGMVADIALHAPGREGDERNHHTHILLTTREIGPDGFTAKNRVLERQGAAGGLAGGLGTGHQPRPGALWHP